jgi:hypothetical protein
VNSEHKGKYDVGTLWCNSVRAGGSNYWSFPKKVEQVLREFTAGRSVLHLFGGVARWGTRLDIDPQVRPDIVGDAWLPPFARASFDVVILDPPYIRLNAQEKNALLRAAGYIAREHLVWFHTIWTFGCRGITYEKGWLVRVGDNCFVRALEIFRVAPGIVEPVEYFVRGPAIKYNRWLVQRESLPFPDSSTSRSLPHFRPKS